MENNKTLQVLSSIIIWAAVLLVGAIPLFFWPARVSSNYPLVLIYLLPKTVLLRIGVLTLKYSGLALAAAYLGSAVSKKRLALKASWIDMALVAFMVWLWLSSQQALNKDSAFFGSAFWLEGFYTYLDYAALFFIGRFFADRASLVKLGYVLTVTTIIISVGAIVEAFFPGVQAFTNVGLTGRSGATTGNAVVLGAYLIMPLALVGGLTAQKVFNGLWAALAAAACGLGAVAVYFTFSRGAWLALAAVAVIIILRTARLGRAWTKPQRLAGAAIALAAILIVALGPRPPQTVVARAFSAFNPSEPTVEARLAAWRQAGEVISKFPIWGTGVDSFAEAVVGLSAKTPAAPMDKPHNFFLEVAATMGLPAFLAFAAWLGLVFAAGARLVRQAAPAHEAVFSALAAAGGYLLALFFLFSTINSAPLFFLMLGLIAGAARDAATLPIVGRRVDLSASFR